MSDTIENNVVPFPTPKPGAFATAEDAVNFIRAGRAAIVMESQATGRSFAYRIERSRYGAKYFVKLMTNGGLEYQGVLSNNGISITGKSDARSDDMAVRAFGYSWRHLLEGRLPPQVILLHQGRCGACHRALRDPTSIGTGIGPECRRKAKLACG